MADFKVAAVFSDHMVLQRDKGIAVFGEGVDGERVTVTLQHGEEEAAVSGPVSGGRWNVLLPKQKAGEGAVMTVQCGADVREFSDIAIGEVWLAGGQSNMELELQNAYEGAQALAEDGALNDGKGPNVRYYYTQKRSYMDDAFFEEEEKTCWTCFGDGSEKCWSAVAYFFARKLAKKLRVTVGVIGCNWGGTSASAWMDWESLAGDSELRSYIDEYEAAVAGKSVEEQIREYDEYEAYHAEWSKRAEELAKTDPLLPWDEVVARCGECKWPGPMNCKNPYRPAGLYECMVKRIAPYTMRGVIWYQGESDDHKPRLYEKLFTKLIEVWRREWDNILMSFLFVQLPMHRYEQDKDFKNWPLIREAQWRVFRTIRHTGIVVGTEFSEWGEIHPRRKREIGERLTDVAMCDTYNMMITRDAYGPLFRELIIHDAQGREKCGKIELVFFCAYGGFTVVDRPYVEKLWLEEERIVVMPRRRGKQTEPAPGSTEARERIDAPDLTPEEKRSDGFEIAGEDKRFFPARYRIVEERILVWSEQVAKPKYVRYLWTNYRIPHIFGTHTGIPLMPFRSDFHDEADVSDTGNAKIQQMMEV
ncbi:MAG: sialate O-acetylesterase [bacterium]|nr:sialate O-acetylesterase [bacterium]